MPEFKAIKVKRTGRAAVVCLRLASSRYTDREQVLRDDLQLMLEHVDTTKLIVDLEGVVSCSSAILGVLIKVQEQLARRGGQLSLCCLHDHLREKVRTLNLDAVFPIYDTESEATAAAES